MSLIVLFLTTLAIFSPSNGQEVASPVNYEIFFDLSDSQETREFFGVAQIEFNCLEQSSKLLLDCKELNITGSSISGENLEVTKVTVEKEFCEIEFNKNLEKGENYILTLDFNGKINSERIGIFEEYYKDNNTSNHLITTNFEFGNARSAFPCFDNPKFKATFVIKVKHAKDYEAIGSTLGISVTEEPSIVTTFQPTPLAINADIVSFTLYQRLKKSTLPLISVNIYHSETRNASIFLTTLISMQAAFRLQFGQSAITNHNYVAVPAKIGRNDNWGSHVVAEEDFLRSLITSTPKKYQEMLQMYANEFAANYLEFEATPGTWNEWWISRGLEKFYEYYVPANTRFLNQFISLRQFVTDVTQIALESDLESDEISGLKFNERAAAIFNMIQGVMGIDNFNEAIRTFLKEFSGSTFELQDLLNELTKQIQEPLPADLDDIFNDWFEIDGYPILKVARQGSTVTLTQVMFNPSKTSDEDRSLYVPINYVSGTSDDELDFEDTSISDWLLPTSELKIENIPESNFIIFNKQQTSYYRVLYDDSTYLQLMDLLFTNSSVHPLTCSQLIDDLGNLARHGYVDYGLFFSFLEYLQYSNVSSYTEWGTANRHIRYLYHRLRGSAAFDRYETFVREMTKNRFDDVGLGTEWDWSEPELLSLVHRQRLNRQYVAELACFSGVDTCVNETMEYIGKLIDGNFSAVLPELIETMACTTFKYDYEILDSLLDYIKRPSNESVERIGQNLLSIVNLPGAFFDVILSAIGCTRNESSLQTTLDLSIIPRKTLEFNIKPSTRRKLFETVVHGSHLGTVMALKFLKENYLAMNQRYDSMTLVFKAFNGYILTEELLDFYTEIVKTYEAKFHPEDVKTAAYETLEASKKEVEWTNTYVDQIEVWLTENNYNGTTTEAPDNGSFRFGVNLSALLFLMFLLML